MNKIIGRQIERKNKKSSRRSLTPMIDRIDAEDEYVTYALDWIERFNAVLFQKFDGLYDG